MFVHVVAKNVSTSQPLPTNGRIELAFDSYLLPLSVVRQTFFLSDLRGNFKSPLVQYDPVARIVTITPLQGDPLQADQSYVVTIASPSSPSDPNGLRSIDGATIDPAQATIEFPVVAADAGPPPAAPTIDFCRDIFPLFRACLGTGCHGGEMPAAGLRLDSPLAIQATAVGQVAHGSNTGPVAGVRPSGRIFGIDMPIIDPGNGGGAPGGNPANSWMLYKLLMAVPSQPPEMYTATLCSGGGTATPTDVSNLHLVMQPAFADPANDPARASLSDHIVGREMPFPGDPGAPLANASGTLTLDELERFSQWIEQPAGAIALDGGTATPPPLVPPDCGCIP